MVKQKSPVLGQIVSHPEFGVGRVNGFGFTTVSIEFKESAQQFSIDEFRDDFVPVNEVLELVKGDVVLTKENLNWIHAQYDKNYLDSDSLVKEKYASILSVDEINGLKAEWIKSYFANLEADQPSLEQAKAIGTMEPRTLVTARAGSGKTRTIVSRAIFLFSKCDVNPSEMLLLAFNKSAAAEMRKRLVDFSTAFQDCHIMTFHALAYALVHPEEDLMTENRIIKVNSLVRELLKDKKFSEMIKKVMLGFFRTDWHLINSGGWHLLDDKEQFLNFRRGLSNESMRGEPIKSLGEKLIADFLFENGIPYKYEKYFKWGDRPYRPDFSIELTSGSGVVIEYFGLKGDPTYDEQTLQKIEFWNSKPNWRLISLYPSDLSSGGPAGLAVLISEMLKDCGVTLRPQSEDELWEQIENRGRYQFTEAIAISISKIRKRNMSTLDFQAMVDSYNSQDLSESAFLSSLAAVYNEYCEYLLDHDFEDFDGLVNRAISSIKLGQHQFSRKASSGDLKALRYLFIDEYQDFTEQFYELTQAIISTNSKINIFCVGDNWQAINTFAGSDLKYFRSFQEFFGEYAHFKLLHNFRSVPSIVELSNQIMAGLGGQSISWRTEETVVRLAELKARIIAPSEDIINDGDQITSSLAKLIHVLYEFASRDTKDITIAVLGHNRVSVPYFTRNIWNKSKTPFECLEDNVLRIVSKEVREHIKFSTVHGFKGLQANIVILLDPISNSFPSVHHTWRLQKIFGQDYESLVEEELRLLYVAITRAEDQLIMICNETKELSGLITGKVPVEKLQKLDWARVDRTFIDEVSLTVWSPSAATSNAASELKNSGFRYYPETKRWRRYIEKSVFNLEAIQRELWNIGLSDTFVSLDYPNQKHADSWKIRNGRWIR